MSVATVFHFHRTHESNIENHLHTNQRENHEVGRKFGLCVYESVPHFYMHTDIYRQFCHLFYYWFGTGFIWATVSYYVVSLLASHMVQIHFISLSNRSLTKLCATRFPFDVKEPFGYTLAIASQFVISMNLCLADVCVLIVLIVPCLVLISTTDDIKYGLDVLNTSAMTNESDFKVTQQFNQIVQFHSKAKR